MKKFLFLALVIVFVAAMAVVVSADEPKLEGIAYIQGHGGHIALVDLATGNVARYAHGKASDALTLSKDGKTIYVFSLDGFSKEIDVATGKQTEWQKLGKKHCGSALAPDGTVWVSDMDDGNVYVYDVKAKKLKDSFNVSKSICGITFSKDGKLAYVSDMPGGFISIVDVATKKVTGKITGAGAYIHRSRMNPEKTEIWQSDGAELKDGKAVGIGYTDAGGIPGSVKIVDVKTNKVIDSLLIGGNPHDVDFSPDGKYALVVTRQLPEADDSAIVVIDTKTKRVVKEYSACKKCHGALGLVIDKKHEDGGKPFLCGIEVNWTEKKLPASAEPAPAN
ncbi:MAG: PQQ-binding-like beta-propeller repeat protein [Nitrospirae bacterium]|nr:PQQ-binding-like beta-propeller repeat protein [Nitrospirota bacterium]